MRLRKSPSSAARIQYDNGRVLVAVDDNDTRPMFRTEITGSSLTSEGEERRFNGFGPVCFPVLGKW